MTISKLRFLEAEGLVEPQRTPSGYRKYTAADVDRLRFVLAAQRDQYLPLRVIREQLDALDRGERGGRARRRPSRAGAEPPAPARAGRSRRRGRARRDARLTRAQLRRRSGLDEAACARPGAVRPAGRPARPAGTAARRSPWPGSPPSWPSTAWSRGTCAPYRAAADREVGLLAQLVAPLARQGGPAARARAAETVHELAALCAQLHGALVRQGCGRCSADEPVRARPSWTRGGAAAVGRLQRV